MEIRGGQLDATDLIWQKKALEQQKMIVKLLALVERKEDELTDLKADVVSANRRANRLERENKGISITSPKASRKGRNILGNSRRG